MMPMKLYVGDLVELKKSHPCGSKNFKILRIGADFRTQCLGCGHQNMFPRPRLEKAIKKILSSNN